MGKKVIYIGISMLIVGILLGFWGTNIVIEGDIGKKITIPYGETKIIEISANEGNFLYFGVNCTSGKVVVNITSPCGEVLNSSFIYEGESWNYSVMEANEGNYIIEIKNIGNSSSSVVYTAYQINSTGIYLMFIGMILAVMSAIVMIMGVLLLYLSKVRERYGGDYR